MGDNQPNENSQGPKYRSFSWSSWVFLLSILLVLYLFSGSSGGRETTWNEFKSKMLLQHDIAKLNVLNHETVEVYIKPASLKKKQYSAVTNKKGPHYFFTIGSVDVFEKQLAEAQTNFRENEKVPVQYTNKGNSFWFDLLGWLLPFILLALFWMFIIRRSRNFSMRSAFDFGKSRPEIFEKNKKLTLTFKDVAGYEQAKREVMEIVSFLKNPQRFIKVGAKIPKGILLVGPSGTGKTLMAKAVAGEAGVPFFSLSGSEFIEMFVGVGASRVRDLFDQAKLKAPSIIFIDEIDAIGRSRSKAASFQANDERESTLNQLLAEMDGFATNSGVIVLAATNRPDILDPALVRPGRFDRHVYLDLPNREERTAIFNVHLAPLKLNGAIDATNLAEQTPGFSGADIANVCNEAALIAARKMKESVDEGDFSDAIDRIIGGIEKKGTIISKAEKKIIAYHEAGHTIVGWMLNSIDPIHKVSIIPRGKSLGGAWYLPRERQIVTRTQFLDQLCVALGGRAAEEVVFGDPSSGALDDLEKATRQAYMMVSQLGFGEKLGNVSYSDSAGLYENAFQKPFSEATARLIDEEVKTLLEEAHETARTILVRNRSKLDDLANALLANEIVYSDQLKQILGARTTNNADIKAA